MIKKRGFIFVVCFMVFFGMLYSESLENNLEKHLSFFTNKELKGRVTGTIGAKKTAEYIYAAFEEIGLDVSFEKKGKIVNVIGYKPGKTEKYVIIGANYDSFYSIFYEEFEGADDNASGVSVLIELARLLANEDLEYGIKFIAFDNGVNNRKGWEILILAVQ